MKNKEIKIKEKRAIKRNEIILSENNRITYVYKQIETGKIIEIVNVSLEIKFQNKLITILRYDSYHGYMHRHRLISLDEKSEIVDKAGVRQRGTYRKLLRWAIEDIKSNYILYKRKLIHRTKSKLGTKIDIDIY